MEATTTTNLRRGRSRVSSSGSRPRHGANGLLHYENSIIFSLFPLHIGMGWHWKDLASIERALAAALAVVAVADAGISIPSALMCSGLQPRLIPTRNPVARRKRASSVCRGLPGVALEAADQRAQLGHRQALQTSAVRSWAGIFAFSRVRVDMRTGFRGASCGRTVLASASKNAHCRGHIHKCRYCGEQFDSATRVRHRISTVNAKEWLGFWQS